VTVTEARATSFGSVAASYDRVRPGPGPDAVDWLVPAGCAFAVDLAAGTGPFTRALQSRAEHVVAIEPDSRMRDVLAARSPGVRVLAGRAEEIPLPDGYAPEARDTISPAGEWYHDAVPQDEAGCDGYHGV